MLSDRTYMRDVSPPASRPVHIWLIGVLVAIFILQRIVDVCFPSLSYDPALRFLALSTGGLKHGFLWGALTYAGLHAGIMHLLVNGLMLFFLGRQLEADIGGKRLLLLFFVGTLGGALGWLAVNFQRDATLIGASAADMALLTVFACMNPRRPITLLVFFILPITLLPIWLLAIVGGIDAVGLIFQEIPRGGYSTSIAHSAHLGGLAAGWLFYRLVLRGKNAAPWASAQEIEKPLWFRKAENTGLTKARYQVDVGGSEDLRAEVDRILDKINSKGFGALTPEEKAKLDEARDLLNRR